MGLSCECAEWDGKTGWCFFHPSDFTQLATKRRRRCASCKKLIDIGGECLEFSRERSCKWEIEEKIYGDTVPMAPFYQCSDCGEIYLNLDAAGYCLAPDEDMKKCMEEYHRLTGFKPLQIGE